MKHMLASIAYLVMIIILAQYNSEFILLAGIPLIDMMYTCNFVIAIPVFLVGSYFCMTGGSWNDLFFIISAGTFRWMIGKKDRNERTHLETLDEELQD